MGENELRPGALLLARELKDPNFDSTVVLLCQHGPQGAYGLVLNRPSHMPLREIFDQLPDQGMDPRRVYIGGPVQPEELQILTLGPDPAPGAVELAPGVHLGGAWDDLSVILSRDPKSLRLFLGYSGWGEGQLEGEVEAGAWEVLQADLLKLLSAPDEAWFQGGAGFKGFLRKL